MNALAAHARVDSQPDTGLGLANPGGHPGCGCYWAVCQSHPQAERWATANLRRQGYTAYLPMLTARRRDRALPTLWHTVSVPLFSGYLFVSLEPGAIWHPIRRTQGIRQILLAAFGIPHRVPAGIVEALQATQDAREQLAAPDGAWTPGKPCSLIVGPFRGHDAVVIKADAKHITVGVMCFGAVRQISVSPDCLISRD